MFRNFTPELGINIVCLLITAAAPTIAIGPLVGLPLGLAAAFGLLAAMKYQKSSEERVRRAAYVSVWLVRIFVVALEQMAYQDAFALRTSLPFGFSAMTWGWIAPLFMGALDLLAYGITAARAAAQADAADHAANLARADQLDSDRREREAEKERAKYAQELELARIVAATETAKAQASATAQAEATKAQAAAQAETAKAKARAAEAQAEADRKRAELEAEAAGREAEAKRKQEEEARKRAEDQAEVRRREQVERRKQEEEARRQQEAERNQRAAQEAAITAKRARWTAAMPEEKMAMIEEAEQEITARTGKKPIQNEIAAVIGVSSRTIRDFLNSRLVKQAA
jgi:predicted outer membrane lipoprotein